MASVTIRNLPDEVKEVVVAEAKKAGRSLESQLRIILTKYANADPNARSVDTSGNLGRNQDWLSRD
jgi:plasmid stability protein